jgi:hypothetical protein
MLVPIVGVAAPPIATALSSLSAIAFIAIRRGDRAWGRGWMAAGAPALFACLVVACAARWAATRATEYLGSWPTVIAFAACVGIATVLAAYASSPLLRARLAPWMRPA